MPFIFFFFLFYYRGICKCLKAQNTCDFFFTKIHHHNEVRYLISNQFETQLFLTLPEAVSARLYLLNKAKKKNILINQAVNFAVEPDTYIPNQ